MTVICHCVTILIGIFGLFVGYMKTQEKEDVFKFKYRGKNKPNSKYVLSLSTAPTEFPIHTL